MDKSALIAFLSLTFMMFVQACTGIWWASKINTTQEALLEWRDNHQAQQIDYPVLINQVNNNSTDIGQLVSVQKDFLDELRTMKEKPK